MKTKQLTSLIDDINIIADMLRRRKYLEAIDKVMEVNNIIGGELKIKKERKEQKKFDTFIYEFDYAHEPKMFYSFTTGLTTDGNIGEIIKVNLDGVTYIGKVIKKETVNNKTEWELEAITNDKALKKENKRKEFKNSPLVECDTEKGTAKVLTWLNKQLDSAIEQIDKLTEMHDNLTNENKELKETVKAQKAANTLNSLHVEDLKKDVAYFQNDQPYSFDLDHKIVANLDQRFSLRQVNEIINKIKASGCCKIMVDNALKSIKDKPVNIEVNSKELSELKGKNKELKDMIDIYAKRDIDLQHRITEYKIELQKLKDNYTIKPKRKIDLSGYLLKLVRYQL